MEKNSGEKLPLQKIVDIANRALISAYTKHIKLGISGLEKIKKNEFGNIALRADIDAEETILNTLSANSIPIQVNSEEHGLVTAGENPQYFAVLDGLDGTNVYETSRGKGKYGTMFAIFEGTDPKYRDYIYSGIMLHSTGELIYALRNSGSWQIVGGKKRVITCSVKTALDDRARVLANSYYDPEHGSEEVRPFIEKLSNYHPLCLNSTAAHFAELGVGAADAVIEYTRKGNLEIATAYGLITEAGGTMKTLDGIDLGNKKYKQFGQKKDEHIIVVSTCTPQLNDQLRELLMKR